MADGNQSMAETAKAQAGAVWSDTKQQASSALEEQKRSAAGGIGELAKALRKAAKEMDGDGGQGGAVSGLTQNAADALERVSGALRNRDLNSMVRDLEGFARSQPALFLGAAVASGFLAMRFLKSGQPEHKSMTSAEPAKRAAPGSTLNDSSDPRRI
jgi:hypothetical protein